MKILITGMNKNQCVEDFYLHQQLEVVPSHYSLIRCLRDMGHTVEQRHVTFGENLHEYDEVIIFLHNPKSFAGYYYNGLYAISQRPDAILAFDDWQIDSIYNTIDSASIRAKYTADMQVAAPADMSPYMSALEAAISIINSKSNRMLISAFSDGDISLLLDYPVSRLFSYNPNPYHLNRQPHRVVLQKQRVFNFASLVQAKTARWIKKQQVTWPIEFYGSRKDKQVRLKEQEMCQVYAEQWGCLMPGYAHAGSGWWRARPLQVADAGSILIGEPAEMMLYYRDKRLANLCAHDIENMSDAELTATARDQRDALYANHPLDKSTQQMQLQRVLDAT